MSVNKSEYFSSGDRVFLNGNIPAIVEEVILQRNRNIPIYLVQYWDQGHRIDLRVEPDDLSREKVA